jgi:hypothetical protein
LGAIALVLLVGVNMETDSNQKIRASLVLQQSQTDAKKYFARVSFQRIVWGSRGTVKKVETIKDEEIYKDFFQKIG